MSKDKTKLDLLEYLVGKKKSQLINYALKKKKFYQAEAAFDLGWSISCAQYYLKNFVQYDLLIKMPTSYRTYYSPNRAILSNLISKQT